MTAAETLTTRIADLLADWRAANALESAVRDGGAIRVLSEHLPLAFVILLISLSTFFFSGLIAAAIRLIPGASRVAG